LNPCAAGDITILPSADDHYGRLDRLFLATTYTLPGTENAIKNGTSLHTRYISTLPKHQKHSSNHNIPANINCYILHMYRNDANGTSSSNCVILVGQCIHPIMTQPGFRSLQNNVLLTGATHKDLGGDWEPQSLPPTDFQVQAGG
jgi:hypothetical protein